MTINIEIRSSTEEDPKILSRTIRKRDREESIRLGWKPDEALYHSYKHATIRRTAFVDNLPVAMWGVCGSPLGLVGQPYLITGEDINKISPIKFARIYKQEVQAMKQLYPHLENFVDASYTGAVRMLKIAGFTLSEPIKIYDSYFQRFTMNGVM